MKVSLYFCTPIALAACLVSGAAFSSATVSSATVSSSLDVMVRGWKPTIEFLGAGDVNLAVERLQDVNELQQISLNNYQCLPETQAFVDFMWKSLENFNLKRFHNRLPTKESDGWRALSVYGHLDGDAYIVGPYPKAGEPPIKALGDVLLEVRAKESDSEYGDTYLIDGKVKAGFNAYSWDSVLAAGEAMVRLSTEGDPQFSKDSEESWVKLHRQKIIQMNPRLDEEDVQIIAPLRASFPASWDLIAKLARFNNVVDNVDSGEYEHLKVSFAFRPKVMKKHYPQLSRHLDSMNDLIKGRVAISNEDGRLVLITVDSKSLTATIEAYVIEGRFLPFKDGKVLTDVKPVRIGEGSHYKVSADATFDLYGVFANVNNMDADIWYTAADGGAVVVASMTEIPDVSIGGRAFGIMPIKFVNAIMPIKIDKLIEGFIGVAVQGNNGKGVLAEIEYTQVIEGGLAQADVNISMEALNNFLVRIGMGIINKRVLPNKKESSDIDSLVNDALQALAADLNRFEEIVAAN